VVEFLPIGEIKGMKIPGAESEADSLPTRPKFFLNPAPRRCHVSPGHYLNIVIYRACWKPRPVNKAPHDGHEERHRQCQRLIKDLTLEYNKLRQGNITKELLEIAGGQLATINERSNMNKGKIVQIAVRSWMSIFR